MLGYRYAALAAGIAFTMAAPPPSFAALDFIGAGPAEPPHAKGGSFKQKARAEARRRAKAAARHVPRPRKYG